MSPSARAKTVDRQAVSKKLVLLLKKRYKGSSIPKKERPVLETLVYAVCLENASHEDAQAAYDRLFESFHDLNEIRVSSISEIAVVFEGMNSPEWRGARVRAVLQYIFEKHFEFAFEGLRRKTLDLASKQLGRIKELSPFVRNYALQVSLGSHVMPVDQQILDASIWLGLLPPDQKMVQAADALKPYARKADAPLFCHLMRKLAVDPRLSKGFNAEKYPHPPGGHDLATAPERLERLFRQGLSSLKKASKAKPKSIAASTKGKTGTKKAKKTKQAKSVARKGTAKSASDRKPSRKTAVTRKK